MLKQLPLEFLLLLLGRPRTILAVAAPLLLLAIQLFLLILCTAN